MCNKSASMGESTICIIAWEWHICIMCSLQLTREYNLQCVYLFYPVLKQHIQYDFEPCDNDNVNKVTADHNSAVVSLGKEAKRWATRIARETNNIRECARKLQVFQALRDSGQKVVYDVQWNNEYWERLSETVGLDGDLMHVCISRVTFVSYTYCVSSACIAYLVT